MPAYTYAPAAVLEEDTGDFAIGATGVLRETTSGDPVLIYDLNGSPITSILVGPKGAHQSFRADISFGFLDFGSVVMPTVSIEQLTAALTAVATADNALAVANTAATSASNALGTVDALYEAERLPALRTRKYLARQEQVTVAAGATQNMAVLTGQGTIRRIWMALDSFGAAPSLDSRLQVLVDGATTPDIDIDLGTLFCSHYFASSGASGVCRIGCDTVSTEIATSINTKGGYALNLDMPFRDGITIRVLNANTDCLMFSQVIYDRETPAPVVLRSAGRTYANKATLLAGDTLSLLNLPAGSAGWLVWSSIVGASTGSTLATWLERDIEIKVDGEASPSWASTGLEDWFLGTFYYHGTERISYPWGVVGANYQGKIAQGIDLRAAYGGIRFDDGINVTMGTESAVTVGHEMSYVTLYYLEV